MDNEKLQNVETPEPQKTPTINREFILTNIIAILSGVSIVSLLMPFITIDVWVEFMGFGDGSIETISGFDVVPEGLWGILLLVLPAVIIAMNYIKQLAPYKKYITLGAPIICLLNLFVFLPGMVVSAEGGGASMDIQTSYAIGGWIMIICMGIVAALGIIQFFGLKTNIALLDEVASKSKKFE